ncbi:5-methyltetrahydropteroyltriglutamate--homocysteine methyltransferase [Chromatiales bacterium (ex Bugula neritina AB1)]|nr:5-methyltetrahydropteroyltriglutamate--homocysteine methyltransferase [Chromatiales bacterium (ex Bugula neritina AB1)]
MSYSNSGSIKTTVVGAYPKPSCTPIGDWFPAADDEEARQQDKGLLQRWSITDYEDSLANAGADAERLFSEATEEIIKDQVGAGIDVPTDGEVRRENYIYYQCRRIDGIDFNTVTHKSVRSGAFVADLPTITGRVSLTDTLLHRDYKVAQSFTDNPVKITIPGPMTITDSIADGFYNDDKQLGADLAAALNTEILSLAEAGCTNIQVDEPVFARKPEQALAYGIENLERCFNGLPDHVTRLVHMCCGYPNALDAEGYLKAEQNAYLSIADAMDESSVNAVSLEDAHRHNDLKLLEHYKNTTILFGVVDVAKSRIETVEEVRQRLLEALEHIDADRLMAAPDCGLGLLGRRLAVAKLKVMSEAAKSI